MLARKVLSTKENSTAGIFLHIHFPLHKMLSDLKCCLKKQRHDLPYDMPFAQIAIY